MLEYIATIINLQMTEFSDTRWTIAMNFFQLPTILKDNTSDNKNELVHFLNLSFISLSYNFTLLLPALLSCVLLTLCILFQTMEVVQWQFNNDTLYLICPLWMAGSSSIHKIPIYPYGTVPN
jgi:hypothetical protein